MAIPIDPILPGDEFPNGGGTGGGTSGTTSSNIVPHLTLSPNENQSIVTGTTLCLNASGVVAFPQEAEQVASLTVGCAPSTFGNWTKTCGTQNAIDAETRDARIIYKYRPFHITGQNSAFMHTGAPNVNSATILGVVSTTGYYFYWEVFKYCNSNAGNCESPWYGSCKMRNPQGVYTTLFTGRVERYQLFRVRSNSTWISWDYTTEGRWAYHRYTMPMPTDTGNFQFFVNALYLNNTWNNLRTFVGSYQAIPNPEDYIWTSNCVDNLVITGNRACYTPLTPGYCKICVSTTDLNPKCVSVVSTPLTLTPNNIECGTCGTEDTSCNNIPNPTVPSVTLTSTSEESIKISWTDSISFTNGLYYEIDVNGDIETVLETDVILASLATGDYTISVRAIDACGESAWSVPQTITLTSTDSGIDTPEGLILEIVDEDDSDYEPIASNLATYKLSWEEVEITIGGVPTYEIWIGGTQTTKLLETIETTVLIGTLPSGTKLSVRCRDSISGEYSAFSEIVQIP